MRSFTHGMPRRVSQSCSQRINIRKSALVIKSGPLSIPPRARPRSLASLTPQRPEVGAVLLTIIRSRSWAQRGCHHKFFWIVAVSSHAPDNLVNKPARLRSHIDIISPNRTPSIKANAEVLTLGFGGDSVCLFRFQGSGT